MATETEKMNFKELLKKFNNNQIKTETPTINRISVRSNNNKLDESLTSKNENDKSKLNEEKNIVNTSTVSRNTDYENKSFQKSQTVFEKDIQSNKIKDENKNNRFNFLNELNNKIREQNEEDKTQNKKTNLKTKNKIDIEDKKEINNIAKNEINKLDKKEIANNEEKILLNIDNNKKEEINNTDIKNNTEIKIDDKEKKTEIKENIVQEEKKIEENKIITNDKTEDIKDNNLNIDEFTENLKIMNIESEAVNKKDDDNIEKSNTINTLDFSESAINLGNYAYEENEEEDQATNKSIRSIIKKFGDNNKKNENKNTINNSSTYKLKNFFNTYQDDNIAIIEFQEEEYKNRKYDSDTIYLGKKFFRCRFLQNRIINKMNLNNNRISYSPNKNMTAIFNSNEINNSGFIRHTINNKSIEQTINNISILNDHEKEKEIRENNSEFLRLVEKAIFSFNKKKYEESYKYLLYNGIINNLLEFGEFLLVVSGFDREVIGDFLSKNHPPNENKEVLNSFINSIDFEFPQKRILECFRFLVSKTNLPKDANLILQIIDSFSTNYYNANTNNNKFKEIYKSPNTIYLLLSTILAINTMFIRKDIKNINIITKQQFIKMNAEIDIEESEKIYKDIKKNPISMSENDYNENIYKWLSNLVIERQSSNSKIIPDSQEMKSNIENNKESKNEDSNMIINEINNDDENDMIINNEQKNSDSFFEKGYSFSISKNFKNFSKKDQNILLTPQKFCKIIKGSYIHERDFMIYDDNQNLLLIWAKNIVPKKISGNFHFIKLVDIIDVYNSIEKSENIKKYIKSNPNEAKFPNNFITISTNTQNIDLKSDNEELVLSWFKALKSLILKQKKKITKENEKATLYIEQKLYPQIEELWKKYIIPKWEKYGEYLNRNNIKDGEIKNIMKILYSNNKYKKVEYIIKNAQNNKNLSHNDIIFIFYFGLPNCIRKIIWRFLIGNSCGIYTDYYEIYKNQVETVNFDIIDTKYHEDINEIFSSDYIINQMIVDIIKIKDLFLCILIDKKLDQNLLMSQTYRIIRIFFSIRNDINYNSSLITLIFIFLILGENEFNVFCNIFNIICNSSIIKYLKGDEFFIKSNNKFFSELLEKYIPTIFEHFKKLEITPELYLPPWFEEIFTNTLDMQILFRVFDLYLFNGEYVLYQIGLTIIKIQEEKLLTLTISETFKNLRKLDKEYSKDFFLEKMMDFSFIKNIYLNWMKGIKLEEQKNQLLQEINSENI